MNLSHRKLLVAVPRQQGPVQHQRPARRVPSIHGAAASRRRDESLRRLPGRIVGPGRPGPGVHQDAVQELPHRHALDAAGPFSARYGHLVRQDCLRLRLNVTADKSSRVPWVPFVGALV